MNKIKTAAAGNEVRERIKAMSLRVLDGLDNILDGMTPPPEPPAPALAVKRRQVANTLRLWTFCDRSQCHRAHCCRGEPLNCLRIGMTALPPEALEPLIQSVHGCAKRDRRNRAAARSSSPANFAAQARD